MGDFTDDEIRPLVQERGAVAATDKEEQEPRALSFVSDQDALMFVNWTSTLLFGGIVFGWASIQMLLEQDQVLNAQCGDTEEACVDQIADYSAIFTVITTGHIVMGAINGMLVDNYGPMKVAATGGLLLSAGAFTVAAANPNSFAALMTGFSMHAAGSSMVFMTAWCGNFAVREDRIGSYLTTNSALFDTSALVPLIMYGAAQLLSVGYAAVWFAYGCVSALVVSVSVFYWGRLGAVLEQRQAAARQAAARETAQKATLVSTDLVGAKKDYTAMHSLSLGKMLRSPQFVLLGMLMSIHIMRMNFYTGGLRDMILTMTADEGQQEFYTTMYSLLFPCGFLFIPPVVYVIDNYDFVTCFDLVTLGSLVWGGAICVDSLPLQLPAFLLFAAVRALFYSSIGVCTAHTFGPLHGSTMFGMLGLMASLLNLCVYPLSVVAEEGSWTTVNLLMLLTLVPVFLARFPLRATLDEFHGGQHTPRKTSSKDIM